MTTTICVLPHFTAAHALCLSLRSGGNCCVVVTCWSSAEAGAEERAVWASAGSDPAPLKSPAPCRERSIGAACLATGLLETQQGPRILMSHFDFFKHLLFLVSSIPRFRMIKIRTCGIMCLRRMSVTPSASSILTSSRNSAQIFRLSVKRCLKCCLILSERSPK